MVVNLVFPLAQGLQELQYGFQYGYFQYGYWVVSVTSGDWIKNFQVPDTPESVSDPTDTGSVF